MRLRPILLASILPLLASCSSAKKSLCDNRITFQEGELALTKNEQVLICGSDKGLEGWREVPLPQAEYQIKVKLADQGYLHPRFERNQEHLDVWRGPREKISKLTVNGADGLLFPDKLRQLRGQPLEPAQLDRVKKWADTELRTDGYGCPTVDVRAQAWDQQVIADVTPGARMRVAGIDYKGLGGLDTETLARYQAIEPGDWHNAREMQLTASRMLSDGLFQTAYFTTNCRGDLIDYHLVAGIGKPRIFRFGVGASTEEFPFTRIWFKNARLDDRASSFTVTAYASPKAQNLDVSSEFYRVPWSRRTYFGPRFFVGREKERSYEVNRARLGIDLGRNFDLSHMRFQGRIGPTLNYVDTVIGYGPRHQKYVSWDGSLMVMSHEYEIGMRDQFEGWTASFDYRGQRKGAGSSINVDRYELTAKHLWNLGAYTPPLFVLASRVQAIGVNTSQIASARENGSWLDSNGGIVPVDYRVFFGGDQNLRGFSRQGLDNGGLGYTTAVYLGFELRLVEELPYHLEPFLLFDSARLGDRRLTLDSAVFTSEGLGVRWASPFGTLRGSAARGHIFHGNKQTDRYAQEWVYFFSFGQEF